MGFDKRGGFGGGRGDFKGGHGKFGGKPRFGGEKEMFEAMCATCQKTCQVPFRPTGERPVYCSDCFRNVREDSGNDFSRAPRNFDAPKRDFAPRREFAPKPAPVAAPDTRIGDLQKQLAALHTKVDALMAIVSKPAAPAVVEEVPAPKKAAAKKKVGKKK